MRFMIPILTALSFSLVAPSWARAQNAEDATVESATLVLREIMEIPMKGIPEAMLAKAQGIAIIPDLLKGGFVVGVRHGKGIVISRDEKGAWRTPTFITITGGSIGWQIGVQSTDVILVFNTRKGIESLAKDKFTIGADIAVAAGPVGRQASAATDAQLKAEILSYSRSRGLFAGVAIDGAAVQIDQKANNAYYAARPGQPNQVPVSAIKLLELVASYTQAGNAAPPINVAVNPQPAPPPPVNTVPQVEELELTRRQLAKSGQELQAILDPTWKKYLALPPEIYNGQNPPTTDQVATCLKQYQKIASDERYRTLSDRREFQETQALLQSLLRQLSPAALKLPPPPPPPQR